jgi:hypothetical protein
VEGEGELEVGDEPDMWAPPVGEREREERRRGTGGPLWAESGGPAVEKKKREGRKDGLGRCCGFGFVVFSFSFFSFLFQIHF